MADKRKRRKGKLQADKRGFSPSTYATITFQGKERLKYFYENREEICRASERSEQGFKFPRFVADEAFHTCAAFVGCGGIATPTSLVTFFKESNASAA